jgi:HSP20 family protein
MNRMVTVPFGVGLRRRREMWNPVVDIFETDEAYVFRADLPGVGKDNINIEIRGARLTIHGERPLDSGAGAAAYHVVERESGLFERSFTLPGNIDVDRAEAKYEDGVLDLVLPKSKERHRTTVAVIYLE